jgi:hypothetical protein
MSVASAERKVLRCKESLRLAYEELQAERKMASEQARSDQADILRAIEVAMEGYCQAYLHQNRMRFESMTPGVPVVPVIMPVRFRYILCALAQGMSHKELARSLPKMNGRHQFVRPGITIGGLSKLIAEARSTLRLVTTQE